MKEEINPLKNLFYALMYSVAFTLCYILFIYKVYEYTGVRYYSRSILFLVFSFIVSVLPVIFYRGFNSVSSIISIFIYILLYVPTIFTFAFGSNEDIETIIILQLLFSVAMSLFFLTDKVVFVRSFNNSKYAFITPQIFAVLTLLSIMYMIYIYKGNLRFVNFAQVYVHRALNDELGHGTVAYIISWLNTVFMPVCLVYGLIKKKKIYFFIGVFACVIIYMATASKDSLLKPVIIMALYFLLSKDKITKPLKFMTMSISIFIFVFSFVYLFFQARIMIWIGAIIFARILGVGGRLNVDYYEFFSNNPQTHYSHINPVNFITNYYPYNKSLGFVIGENVYKSDVNNANANFWATDGFAAYGIAGFIFVNIVFIFLLVFLNTITRSYDKRSLLLLFVPFMISLLNVSLFQTMWSGGGLFLVIILLFSNFFIKKEEVHEICTY